MKSSTWPFVHVPAGRKGVGSAVHRAAMLRRARNSQARHLAWSEQRQETDAMAVIQLLDREEWEGQTTTQVRLEGFVE